jgi:thiol-disulfide isomerase/thioredoxin
MVYTIYAIWFIRSIGSKNSKQDVPLITTEGGSAVPSPGGHSIVTVHLFHAPWCGYCVEYKKNYFNEYSQSNQFDKLTHKPGPVSSVCVDFVEHNIDVEQDVFAKYEPNTDNRGVPALFIEYNKTVKRVDNRDNLDDEITNFIKLNDIK